MEVAEGVGGGSDEESCTGVPSSNDDDFVGANIVLMMGRALGLNGAIGRCLTEAEVPLPPDAECTRRGAGKIGLSGGECIGRNGCSC